jgi:ribose 5-phosphate isomerase B
MLYIGADHNGFKLKAQIKKYLQGKGVEFLDCGAFALNKEDDYVDYAEKVAKKIKTQKDLGLLLCGSGHGMVIAANKISDIRAIMPLSAKSAIDGRRDDHANILVIAAWEFGYAQAKKIMDNFLKTKEGNAPRYLRRLKKIKKLEK